MRSNGSGKSNYPTNRLVESDCDPAGFTLIELILVLTVLTIAVSIAAPALANFFRGRTLDSEARQLLALTRQGQSRAASEGIPMELWFDSQQNSYGLEAEPSYESTDPKAITFTLDKDVQLEIVSNSSGGLSPDLFSGLNANTGSRVRSNHPNLPVIRFLPDGTQAESSPQSVRLIGRDGQSVWIQLAHNRLNYEIRARKD